MHHVSAELDEVDLRRFFLQYGKVSSVTFDRERERAVVGFTTQEWQNKAIAMGDKQQLGGISIRVVKKGKIINLSEIIRSAPTV